MTTQSEYEQQAKDFCTKWGVDVNIKAVLVVKDKWSTPSERIQYAVTISRQATGVSISIDFFGSSIDYEKVREGERVGDGVLGRIVDKENRNLSLNNQRKAQTVYSILACIEKHFDGSLDDFIQEFGYEINSGKDWKEVNEAHKESVRQAAMLKEMFPEEEAMNELKEIY
jgi:hypothetical protein